MFPEGTIAHTVYRALADAGFNTVITDYAADHMSLVAGKTNGATFDVTVRLRIGQPETIGRYLWMEEGEEE